MSKLSEAPLIGSRASLLNTLSYTSLEGQILSVACTPPLADFLLQLRQHVLTFGRHLNDPPLPLNANGGDRFQYFVYKRCKATGRQPMQWATRHGLRESRTTISRAIEPGWVALEDGRSKPLGREAALTDEG